MLRLLDANGDVIPSYGGIFGGSQKDGLGSINPGAPAQADPIAPSPRSATDPTAGGSVWGNITAGVKKILGIPGRVIDRIVVGSAETIGKAAGKVLEPVAKPAFSAFTTTLLIVGGVLVLVVFVAGKAGTIRIRA